MDAFYSTLTSVYYVPNLFHFSANVMPAFRIARFLVANMQYVAY